MKRLIFKEDGLNGSSNTPSGYRYVGYDGTTISQKSGATVSGIGESSLPYSVYTARFSQSGTASPVVTVYENTIGNIVWTRLNAGIYKGTLTGAFSSDKVYLSCNNAVADKTVYFYSSSDPNAIYIDSINWPGQPKGSGNGLPVDYNNTELSIEIKVYP